MQNLKINSDYLNVFREPLFFFKTLFIKRNKKQKTLGRILIVNTCLIGEFAASLPAMSYFIQKSKVEVDLIVSPPLKELAQRINGIKNVFISKSVYSRIGEKAFLKNKQFRDYDTIFFMRMSNDAYSMLKEVKTREVKTSYTVFSKYGFYLFKNLLMKKYPKRWADVNFEMFGEKSHRINFDKIFDFKKKDFSTIEKFSALKTKEQIVIIHTGASWIMNQWGKDKWAKAINQINKIGKYRFIFVGGNREKEDFDYISQKLDFKIYSLIGKIGLKDLMILIKKANYFIGIDSGPANMARLADTRSLVILGPGPHMYLPENPKDIVLDKSNGRGLYQRFFHKKNGFIDKITPDEVFTAFKKLQGKN